MVECEDSPVQEEEPNVDLCLPPAIGGLDVSSEHVSCHSDNYIANQSLDSSVVEVEQRSSHSDSTDEFRRY